MKFLNLHTHTATQNPEIVELVNQYPDEFDASAAHFSIGVHPWRIDEARLQSDLEIVASKLCEPNCLAVGECGLDKRIETPIGLQARVFETQLSLAQEFRKPVVVHCVAAYQEIIETKKRMNIGVPVIVHGFSKNVQVAKSLLDAGFYLSFGKWLLRNPELERTFASVPDDRFFLETDTAHESIEQVYELAARYRNVAIDDLKLAIAHNFHRVFGYEMQ